MLCVYGDVRLRMSQYWRGRLVQVEVIVWRRDVAAWSSEGNDLGAITVTLTVGRVGGGRVQGGRGKEQEWIY